MNLRKSIAFGAAAILLTTAVACGSGNAEKKEAADSAAGKTAAAEKPAPAEKKYVEVYSFKGSGKKKSPVFELMGNNTRVKYKYNSGTAGMGIFSLYVTPEGEDVMKTGGIPEIMISSDKEESESSIVKSAGKYYLDVNAVGKWEIIVEEER